jgi:hypothetical protein
MAELAEANAPSREEAAQIQGGRRAEAELRAKPAEVPAKTDSSIWLRTDPTDAASCVGLRVHEALQQLNQSLASRLLRVH